MMRAVADSADGQRLRALIVLLWRAGLRVGEALALQESDLDPARGAILVRRGKGGKRREVGMDRWAWGQLDPWLQTRRELPVGALLCVIHGRTAGRHWEPSAARKQLHHAAAAAGSGGGSPRTSYATPMQSRWHTRESRSWSSSDSSDTPTSGSPASTSKASTAPRSSTPSTDAHHR